MEDKSIDVNGIRMRWLEHGQGMPVILLHGIPTSPLLWRKVMPLVPKARLLAWEMVGYGDSIDAGRDRDISIKKQAGYLAAWMRALQLERVILVGHDLGGGVAQIAALENQSSCAGLVLTNAIGYDSWPIPSVLALQKLGALVKHTPNAMLRLGLGSLLVRGHDDLRVARESLDLHFAKYAAHDGARALVRQARALDTRDTLAVQDRLSELRAIPSRVVWGAADQFQKLHYGERFAADLGCRLMPISGGKHFVPEDHPEVLADAISSVLEEAQYRQQTTAMPS